VTSYQEISTATWVVRAARLVAGLAGVLVYLVLTGAITRRGGRGGSQRGAELPVRVPPVLVGAAGERAGRAGHHRRADSVVIPGIYIGVRLAVSIEALVVEGRRGTQAMGRS
jgi:hypothetical protein